MARLFNGIDSYDTFSSSLIGTGGYPYTVSCWFWPWEANLATPQILFSFNDAAYNNAVNVFIDNNQIAIETIVGGVGASPIIAPIGIVSKRWYNVTLVATSATNRTMYVNLAGLYGNPGSPVSVTDTTNVVLSGLTTSLMGAAVSSGTPFDFYWGGFDELAIWNVALIPAEVKMISERLRVATSVRYLNLKHFIKFGYGSKDIDMINSNTLTIVGNSFQDSGAVFPFIPWPMQRLVQPLIFKNRAAPFFNPSIGGHTRVVVQTSG